MTVPTLSVCLHCGYPQPGRHATSCDDRRARKNGIGVSDREDPSLHCATGIVDGDLAAARIALRAILRQARTVVHRSDAAARLDRIAAIARTALTDTGGTDGVH